ncbi:sensory box histidine kinase [Aquipluma nitroreducens]|uniref:Sensory box histidine kinase n=1 Tax=Aquipluma nitroreducens TaxID=2010828 RepID=A0A5K7SCR3_9BACT|nr:HAMP domain-containing protein [Aquipluma nitroreducens]BBE19064.1 sensory box histidine kinase [Aquipluma nitroreducens]
MKTSIRTKFILGMVFLFIIILVLLGFSAFYLNKLSTKTGAILKENYVSVVYAREMTKGLTNINQELATSFLMNRTVDSLSVNNELSSVSQMLQLEINNITEPGEDKLASNIENGIKEYRQSVEKYIKSPGQVELVLQLQKGFVTLNQQLEVLSQMNGKAIEVKSDDAKVSAKKALAQMTILGSLCFLIAFSFTYSFASYFNERFSQLYMGIKEISSNNFGQRLYFDGTDEFYEISLVFNEMAEKLHESNPKMSVPLADDFENDASSDDLWELKTVLAQMKSLEEQAKEVISKIESGTDLKMNG